MAKYLETDLASEADLAPQPVVVQPAAQAPQQDEVFVWPGTGVITNILVDKSSGKELADSACWLSKFAKYKPLEVKTFWNEDGRSAKAVVRFNDDWHGFIKATEFEKEFEHQNHGKKGWNAQKTQPGSTTYGWCARSDDYDTDGPVGDYLRQTGKLRAISDIVQEAAQSRHRIVAHPANEIDLTNETLEELQSKYNEETLLLSRMLEEKDKLQSAFVEETRRMQRLQRDQIQRILLEQERLSNELEKKKRKIDCWSKELNKREARTERERQKLDEEKKKYQGGGRRGVDHRVLGVRIAECNTHSMASSSSPTLWTSPAIVSNPRPEDHGAGQHGHIGTSSETQPPEDIAMSVDPITPMSGQVYHKRIEGQNVGTPSSAEQSHNDGNATTPTDPRKLIEPYGDSFSDATRVVRDLNKIVNNHWRGSYTKYTSVPYDVKELWWNEFMRHFRWAETDETKVRRIFDKKVGDHMRNVMNKAKTTQVRPWYITIDNWTEMMRIWGTEEHKQASERNKKNRASTSSDGRATYAGGSINIGEHKRRISEELGREPTYSQTFERTFLKKDKTYVSSRARAIKKKFDELAMGNSSGGDGTGASDASVDQNALWVEASGGVKRGKIFGLGSLARECARKVGASSNASGSRRSRSDAQVYEEVRHLKELLKQKDEKMDAMTKKMERVVRRLQMDEIEEYDVSPTDCTSDEENDDGGAGEDDDDDGTATPLSTGR